MLVKLYQYMSISNYKQIHTEKKFLVDLTTFHLLSVIPKGPEDTFFVKLIVEHAIQLMKKSCCTPNDVQTLVFYRRLPGLNRHRVDLVHQLSANYFFHSRKKVGPIVHPTLYKRWYFTVDLTRAEQTMDKPCTSTVGKLLFPQSE